MTATTARPDPGPFPRRTVHLDFHTGPAIPDVGAGFDPAAFAGAFVDARVDSVTVFAKCHHGHLYHATGHPARHPSLPPDLDLLGEQVAALHSAGVRAPIYLSVQVDEYAAAQHPEWVALDAELRQVKWAPGTAPAAFQPGWRILDMSSPYQDYLADQLDEVLRRFTPVDGIFLDMCWDQPSAGRWAVDGMRRAGLDPADPGDRDRWARRVAHAYMARFQAMVEPHLRDGSPTSVWFNSRPRMALAEERRFVRHVEIESLPTGGWGYSYFPYVARFVRPLGLPALSHTGRFHKSWGDHGALKPAAALRYECTQMLAYGITAGIGDLLHPRAVPHPATYALIGSVYSHLERCEPFQRDARPVADIALLVDPALGDHPGPAGMGAVRALQQLRHQFDIVPPVAELSGYRAVVVPETTTVDAALAARLSAYLAAGGSLLLAGPAALDADGQPVLTEQGVVTHGESPYRHTFLRPTDELGPAADGFDHVMYERGTRMTAAPGATVLCGVVEPYFERGWDHFSGHDYTVPDRLSGYAAVVQNGRVVTFAVPVFEAFGRHAPVAYRELVGRCLDRLLPEPAVRAGGPVHLEVSVLRGPDSTVVHLLSFLAARQGENVHPVTGEVEGFDIVHDPFPVVDAPVAVRVADRPVSVRLEPEGRDLTFTHADGYARFSVTMMDGHVMVVIR